MSNIISPANVNFTLCNGLCIYKGAEWSVAFTVAEREVTAGSIVDTPIDLTGYTGRAAIKKHAGDDTPVALPLVEITDATEGQVKLSLTAAETEAIVIKGKDFRETTDFQYDVYLEKDGLSYRALMGKVEVSPSVLDGDDGEA